MRDPKEKQRVDLPKIGAPTTINARPTFRSLLRNGLILGLLAVGLLGLTHCKGDQEGDMLKAALGDLDRLRKGASVHFATPLNDDKGKRLPCGLPAGKVCSPSGNPCDHPDGKFPASSANWDHDIWKALAWSPKAPHPTQVCVSSAAEGDTTTYTATAHTDLDCDGKWSTFTMVLGKMKTGSDGSTTCTSLFDPATCMSEQGERLTFKNKALCGAP